MSSLHDVPCVPPFQVGDRCITVSPVTVRRDEDLESDVLEDDMPIGTLLEVVEVGQGRRIKISSISLQGWVSFETKYGEPLVVKKEDDHAPMLYDEQTCYHNSLGSGEHTPVGAGGYHHSDTLHAGYDSTHAGDHRRVPQAAMASRYSPSQQPRSSMQLPRQQQITAASDGHHPHRRHAEASPMPMPVSPLPQPVATLKASASDAERASAASSRHQEPHSREANTKRRGESRPKAAASTITATRWVIQCVPKKWTWPLCWTLAGTALAVIVLSTALHLSSTARAQHRASSKPSERSTPSPTPAATHEPTTPRVLAHQLEAEVAMLRNQVKQEEMYLQAARQIEDDSNKALRRAQDVLAAGRGGLAKRRHELALAKQHLMELQTARRKRAGFLGHLGMLPYQRCQALVALALGAWSLFGSETFKHGLASLAGSIMGSLLVVGTASYFLGIPFVAKLFYSDSIGYLLEGHAPVFMYLLWLALLSFGIIRWCMGENFECAWVVVADEIVLSENGNLVSVTKSTLQEPLLQ